MSGIILMGHKTKFEVKNENCWLEKEMKLGERKGLETRTRASDSCLEEDFGFPPKYKCGYD